MKPFSELSAEELAMENLFIRWVRFPDDPPIRSFWEGWIVKYPAMKETVNRARELVLMASDWNPNSLSNQEVNSIWGRIRSSLENIKERDSGPADHALFRESAPFRNIGWGLLSIALIILSILVFFSVTR